MERLPRTKVFVLKGKALHYPEDGAPSHFEKYTGMPSVTDGKPGGAIPSHYA